MSVAVAGSHYDNPVGGHPVDEAIAIDEFLLALREYAHDWQERLYLAPNRHSDWGLVQLTELSTQAQLRAWAVGESEPL